VSPFLLGSQLIGVTLVVMEGNGAPAKREDWTDEIASMSLAGHSIKTIHDLTGVDAPEIIRIMTSSSFARAIDRARKHQHLPSAEEMLQSIQPLAVGTATELMLVGSERVRARMALGLLDRGGNGPKTKTDVNFRGVMMTGQLTEDDLRQIFLERMKRIRGDQTDDQKGD
jgi:hypothetical protein